MGLVWQTGYVNVNKATITQSVQHTALRGVPGNHRNMLQQLGDWMRG